MNNKYFIYRLQGTNITNKNKYFYVGSTPQPAKRIRQHNSIIKGGAKSTTSKLNILEPIDGLCWNYQFLLMTEYDKRKALSLEWHIKHKTKNIKNINNLLKRIDEILPNDDNTMFINKEYENLITYLPINFKISFASNATTV